MNILLVNPWIYDFAAYDLWLKPLGLLYIASFLEKFEHRVYLINCLDRNHPVLKEKYKDHLPPSRRYDCGKFFSQEIEKPAILKDIPRRYKRYGIPLDIFEEELTRIKTPDVIGVTSGMTYWYPGVFEVIRRLKEKFSDVPCVLGGIYATLCYEHAKKYSGADYVIKGPGELLMLKIVNKIEGRKKEYPEVFLKKTINTLLPAYHLLSSTKSVAILTSRGCPFSCSYCASRLIEPRFIQREPESVLKEINWYVKNFKVEDIAFYDDALLVNASKHIIPILKGIVRKSLEVRFHTPNGLHVRYITREIAKLFYAANFKTIRLSLESVSPERQKDSSNKVTREDFLRCVDNLNKAGYRPDELDAYVMVGLPGQEIREVVETLEFAHKAGVRVKIVQFSPIPGTPEFEKAFKESNLPLDEPLLQNNSIFPLWMRKISYEDLYRIKNMALKFNQELSK
ncbi:MAG TPA: radical SAM protein [Candidatus Aerophobetes bacterium]|uniref:Radical SAM protein n=2 Tax=Aerophobetes bacterium TaxID=2030807 RepID=A0A7V0MZ49_UNCAE|nr:radical SAM protein [Candidatus Aerophobetes bacterium]